LWKQVAGQAIVVCSEDKNHYAQLTYLDYSLRPVKDNHFYLLGFVEMWYRKRGRQQFLLLGVDDYAALVASRNVVSIKKNSLVTATTAT